MQINIGYLILFIGTVIAAFSQILLKKSANKQHSSIIREYLNPYVIIGYGMMFVSMLFTIIAYKTIAYKSGPIIESLGYIMVMVLSLFFFHEKITKRKWIGTLFVITGVIIFCL